MDHSGDDCGDDGRAPPVSMSMIALPRNSLLMDFFWFSESFRANFPPPRIMGLRHQEAVLLAASNYIIFLFLQKTSIN